jgi:CheY-like chemotaxis protein
MRRRRVLIVDDEIGSTRLLKENLEMTDLYEVRVENRPENALAVARQFKPDAVLVDIVMPNMSGKTIAKALLCDPELKSVAIAFMTAADRGLLPPDTDPAVDPLPRLLKPATMDEILRFLDTNLLMRPVSGATAPAQPQGGNNE